MGFRSLIIGLLALLPIFTLTPVQASELPQWREPLTAMEFIRIPEGCFRMGNPLALDEEVHYRLQQLGFNWPRFADETPVHEVCLSEYWIGRMEVTASQWLTLMHKAAANGQDQRPASAISWEQSQAFLKRLNQNSAQIFRLPTEAEWEYACRGGASTEPDYTLNPDRREEAWYNNHDNKRETQTVGQLKPNDWGLYDMLGNVWEWTQDNYSSQAYTNHKYNNPRWADSGNSVSNNQRVIRGGSHRSEHRHVRCSARGHYGAHQALPHIGFRVVMEIQP
tara:strand:- start:10334 stop:11170 length:837 start_codon:yes stop_codon:yes gene_type:complete